MQKKTNSKAQKKIMKLITLMVCIFSLGMTVTGCAGKGSNNKGFTMLKKTFVVGKDIKPEAFKEFYYTKSSTAYPPKFQRYYFYMEDGKPMFYHEKREGNKVFLEEEDITFSGGKELTNEEWETFWEYMCMGKVKKRTESITSGGSGPWLYMYWDGDENKKQEFTFREDDTILSFEEFCEELKEKCATEIERTIDDEDDSVSMEDN